MNVENFDQQDQEQKPSQGSRVVKWLGCGCLVILLLCGGGFGLAWVFMGDQMMASFEASQIYQESLEEAQVSPGLIENLGEPAKPETILIVPTPSTEDGKNFMVYKVPFSGPNGKATVNIKICADPGSVERTEFFAEIEGGDRIELPGNGGGFQLDIDDGAGDEERLDIDEKESKDED